MKGFGFWVLGFGVRVLGCGACQIASRHTWIWREPAVRPQAPAHTHTHTTHTKTQKTQRHKKQRLLRSVSFLPSFLPLQNVWRARASPPPHQCSWGGDCTVCTLSIFCKSGHILLYSCAKIGFGDKKMVSSQARVVLLSICPSVGLSVSLSVCLFLCLFLCLSINQSIRSPGQKSAF